MTIRKDSGGGLSKKVETEGSCCILDGLDKKPEIRIGKEMGTGLGCRGSCQRLICICYFGMNCDFSSILKFKLDHWV